MAKNEAPTTKTEPTVDERLAADDTREREHEPVSYAGRMERALRLPRGGEGAVIVSALVELHRASLHDGSSDGRYLRAARVIGDELVAELLGPSEGAAR